MSPVRSPLWVGRSPSTRTTLPHERRWSGCSRAWRRRRRPPDCTTGWRAWSSRAVLCSRTDGRCLRRGSCGKRIPYNRATRPGRYSTPCRRVCEPSSPIGVDGGAPACRGAHHRAVATASRILAPSYELKSWRTRGNSGRRSKRCSVCWQCCQRTGVPTRSRSGSWSARAKRRALRSAGRRSTRCWSRPPRRSRPTMWTAPGKARPVSWRSTQRTRRRTTMSG